MSFPAYDGEPWTDAAGIELNLGDRVRCCNRDYTADDWLEGEVVALEPDNESGIVVQFDEGEDCFNGWFTMEEVYAL